MAVIDIKILKLENAGEFWAKEIKSCHMSAEGTEFEKLSRLMNDHFNSDDQVFGRILKPYPGQICIGKSKDDGRWYRVRIKHVMKTSQGRIATCFSLDHAETCQVNVLSLREPDDMYLNLPYQAKRFVVHGIQPVSMETDWESMRTSLKPAKEWDVSARDHVQKTFKTATNIQAELMLKDELGRIHIRVYVTLNDGKRVCLNDDLVERDYATKGVPLTGDDSTFAAEGDLSGNTSRQSPSSGDERPRRSDRRDLSREVASSSDESYYSDRQTDRSKEMSNGRPNFKPGGNLSVHNAKPRIPSPHSDSSLGERNTPDSQSSPPARVSSTRNTSRESPTQTLTQGAVRPAGRAAFMMSVVSKDKKPGHSSPQTSQNTETRSPQHPAVKDGVIQSPTVASSVPALENTPPVSTQSKPVGRGLRLLNLLPTITSKHQAPGVNTTEQSQSRSGLSSQDMRGPAENNEGHFMDDFDEEGASSPKRPRTPNNVRFSDADEILEPRETTPPPGDVQPTRSILKKSPSPGHNMSMDYCPGESSSSPFIKKSMPWSSEEEESASEVCDETFRAAVSRPATDLLYQLKSGCMFEDRPSHGVDNVTPESENVLYMGPTKPKAILRLDEVLFADLMRKVFPDTQTSLMNKLACFAWTPIQRGLDVASVTLKPDWSYNTYLFPLLYQLQQTANYQDLPKGFGPRLLILTSSWKSARLVYDNCQRAARVANMTPYSNIRVMVIFGGGNDKKLEVSLVNGCDILVATPHCLLRMLKSEFTSLNRLCHLVLEDADILTEEFTKQVREIMELYQRAFRHQTDRVAPKQLLTFSERWTPSLTAFTRLYMTSPPTIIITRPSEAAIFGKVKMIPISCDHDDRMDRLLNILDPSLGQHTGKTLIFTSEKEARNLHEMLKCCSHFTLLACSGVSDSELNDVKRRWSSPQDSNTQLLLVLTDEALLQIFNDITDANTVIHYQSPGYRMVGSKRKWNIGIRLQTMRKGFINPVADRKACSKCRSYLFVTEYLGEEAINLVMLLQRLYLQVPDLLLQRAEYFMKKIKKGKPNELCTFMKAFGKCRDEKKCSARHIVFSSLDSPESSSVYQTLPQHGEIKVHITHVHTDGSCLYGRLLEHTADGKTTVLNAPYMDLTMRINLWFSAPSHRTKCDVPQQGALYAVEDLQHTFNRVEVRRLPETGRLGQVIVYFVDIGMVDTVSIDELYQLPEDLAKIKFQVVELFVCRVKPVDHDKEWTGQASAFLSDLAYNKTLDGTILLSMANTLWLDPLVERERLQEVKVISTKYNLRTELLNNGYGEENNQHLYLLYSACRDRLSLPDELYNPEKSATKAYTVYGKPLEVLVESLPAHTPVQSDESWESEFVEVYVSAVCSPDLLYLQLANRQKLWLDLQEDLETYVRLTDPQPIQEIKKGTLIMAKFPLEEDRWYRGKVMDLRSTQVPSEDGSSTTASTEVDVFFLDTGEQEWVSSEDIQPLDVRYLQLPFQAIEAILMHLVPKGDTWPDSVSDFIWDFTRTEEDEPVPKKLYVKVVSSGQARHIGNHHYGIELYDASRKYSINLASHLVARGMADFTSEYKQELFAVPETETCYSKLATVCQVIAHVDTNNPHLQDDPTPNEDSTDTHVQLCKRVRATITENLEGDVGGGGGGEDQVVSWLCTLLMCVWDELVVETVCTALSILVSHSQSNVESVESRLDVTCEVLEFSQSHIIQKAVLGLWCALMHDIHCRETLLTKGSARILSNILNSSQDAEVTEACVDTILLLVNDVPADHGMLRVIGSSGLISAICKSLLEKAYTYEPAYNLSLSVQCVQVLSVLARYPGLRDTLRKQGAVKHVCGLLGDPETEPQLVEVCVTTLDRLSSNNRFNKDLMNTFNMISICGSLAKCGDLSKDTCDMCRSLQSRLESVKKSSLNSSPPRKSQTPSQGELNRLKPSTKTHIVQGLRLVVPQMPVREAKPDVVWAQDKWNLLLRVQVRGVSEDEPVACFLPHSVKFQAQEDDVLYTCDLTLYELIEPDLCEVGVCAGEVRLGLRKSSKGRWPRLTKEKLKLPYIKVDFDRFIDSSDSDTDDLESPIDSPLSLVQRNLQRHVPFGRAEGSVHKKVRGNFNPELLEASDSKSDSSQSSDDDHPDRHYDGDHFGI